MPGDAMDRTVNITVVTFNRLECTRKCLDSLRETAGHPFVLTVVDNDSRDGTRDYLEAEHAAGRIDNLALLDDNYGISIAYNLGWELADAPYYMKVDNDVLFLRQDWLRLLVDLAEFRNDFGMIGFGRNRRGYTLKDWEGHRLSPVGHVGGCTLIPREVHSRLGYWNEDYRPYGEEDADFGLRARLAGFINVLLSDSGGPYIAYTDKEDEGHEDYARWKDMRRERNVHGLFAFNDILFKCGFRDLRVERKHLPERVDGRWVFRANRDYLRMMAELEARYAPHLEAIVASDDFRHINEELGFNIWY